MVSCNKEGWIQLALDGELDPIGRLRLRAHRALCPGCATEFRRLRRLSRLIRRLRYRHPRAKAMPRQSLGWPGALWDVCGGQRLGLGALVALAVCFALTIALHDADSALRREVIAGHVRMLQTNPLADRSFAVDQAVGLRLGDTTDLSLPVIDLSAVGFPLVGARIDHIASHPAAVFVYRANEHVINLFVWAASTDWALTPGAWSAEGFSVCHWHNRVATFFAVSDLNAEELDEFERLYRARRRDMSYNSRFDPFG
jgi:anti-sigma factor RsiW